MVSCLFCGKEWFDEKAALLLLRCSGGYFFLLDNSAHAEMASPEITTELSGNPVITPTTPLTLTLRYDEADLPEGVPESFFDVYWYDPIQQAWNPLQVLNRDPVHNNLTVLLNHFSEFALLAEEPRRVYLPLVRR